MGFWDEPQGAAIFKHAVLKTYAPLYANKQLGFNVNEGFQGIAAPIPAFADWYSVSTGSPR